VKIAILYSGLIRMLPETIQNNLDYFSGNDIDLYFSLWDNVGYTDQINAPDNIYSKRLLPAETKITENYVRDIIPQHINIKKIKIETNKNDIQFDLINGMDRPSLRQQYYKIWDCYNLLDRSIQYDAIIRLRCDLLLNNKIDFDYLFQSVLDNKIIFASKIWYDFTWKPGIECINDMIWISNDNLMQKACNIYMNADKINNIILSKNTNEINFGERICFMNLEAEKIIDNILTFDFDYQVLR
jgi:hypothetical protein